MENKIQNHWNERWCKVDVETNGTDYFFSDHGRIKKLEVGADSEKLLKGSRLTQGYLLLNLTLKGGKKKRFFVHKLIAEEWVKKDHEEQTYVIHIDRNKDNSNFKNLTWMSKAEMTQFQTDLGVFLPQNRKKNPRYKLNPTLIRLIKRKVKEGKTKKNVIAKQFGISRSHIDTILNNEAWKHVK
jgi:hypothetical protein